MAVRTDYEDITNKSDRIISLTFDGGAVVLMEWMVRDATTEDLDILTAMIVRRREILTHEAHGRAVMAMLKGDKEERCDAMNDYNNKCRAMDPSDDDGFPF